MTRHDRSGCPALLPLIILALTAAPASAQDLMQAQARLHKTIQHFIDQKQISGAVVQWGNSRAGYYPEGLVAIGQRSIDLELPMKPATLFRIASMTKPITAIGIMMLVDDGKISIDDPVEKHLPEFKGQMLVADRSGDTVTLKKPKRPITIRDLLTHTSGMPGGPPPGLSDLYQKRNHTLAEAAMAYSQRPLEFEPGSKWAYCNVGIDTLGRIIEVVSEQSYEDFLKDRLFDPLGMESTTFYPSSEQLHKTAVTYEIKDGELEPVKTSIIGPPEGAQYPVPAGGLYSNAADLSKIYRMMLKKGILDGRRYLSKASVAEMTKIQTGDLKAGFVDGSGWGLGWGIVREPQGVTAMLSPGTFGHGGAWGTQAWIDPVKDRYIILLIQRAGLKNSDDSDIRREIQKVVFGE